MMMTLKRPSGWISVEGSMVMRSASILLSFVYISVKAASIDVNNLIRLEK